MADLTPFPFGEDFLDIIIDSAVLYADGAPLSVSRGGITFEPNEEWDDYPFPGKRMAVRRLREVARMSPVLRGNLMLTGERQLSAYRPGATWADHATIGGARTMTPGAMRTPLAVDDYLANVLCVWKRVRGDFIAVEFPIAICRKWSIGAGDNDEGTIPVEIEAVASRPTGGAPPFRVYTLPEDTDTDDLPTGEDGDLPEDDEDLGNIILDHNALSPFYDATVDGALLNVPHDASASSNDGYRGGLASPTFERDALGADLHAVRIGADGAGYYVAIPIKTAHTWYYVVDGVVGGGSAGVGGPTDANANIADTDGAPGSRFSFGVRADGLLTLAWNNSGGAEGANQQVGTHVVDDGPHLIRIAWSQASQAVYVYVDGALDMTVSSANVGLSMISCTYVHFGNYDGSPLAKGRINFGRILVYDRPHVGAIAAPVEASLQATWGTP
jgi:hypothetical protein